MAVERGRRIEERRNRSEFGRSPTAPRNDALNEVESNVTGMGRGLSALHANSRALFRRDRNSGRKGLFHDPKPDTSDF